ncbi:MAG: PAS domain-containing protein [Dissulfurispiraceae bacterium]
MLFNGQGRCLKTNRMGLSIMGYKESEVIGKTLRDFSPEEMRPNIDTAVEDVLTGKQSSFETIQIRPEQQAIIWSAILNPVYRPDGNIRGFVGVFSDITERKRLEAEREKLIVDLQEALSQVKQLSGLLPICSSCKKIRDDKGYWKQIEAYISDHSDALFTHAICPECGKQLYPEHYDEVWGKEDK